MKYRVGDKFEWFSRDENGKLNVIEITSIKTTAGQTEYFYGNLGYACSEGALDHKDWDLSNAENDLNDITTEKVKLPSLKDFHSL